jgi:DNA-binding CsgD family transcriptional regulator
MMLFQMKWTESLHGSGSLRDALTELSEIFGAPVVHLHRTCTRSGRQRTIASVDRDAREGARPLTRGVGPALLASVGTRARHGTLWTRGEVEDTPGSVIDERTTRWMSDRRFREVAIIPLSWSETEIDILELYLPARLSAHVRAHLECVAAAVAAAWARREKGMITRRLSAAPAISGTAARTNHDAVSLLSPSNPSRLTAAEMRICGMVESGATTSDISRTLRISESTLRTHLRSIYAKTGVGGQVELVHALLRSG